MTNAEIAKRALIEARKHEAATAINDLIAAAAKELALKATDADDFRDAVLDLVTEEDS